MTIFLPKVGICGLKEQNISSLNCPGILDSGCATLPNLAHLLHIILSTYLQLLVPLFPCLPSWTEEKLERLRALIPHFF